jgi:hypothetical protein
MGTQMKNLDSTVSNFLILLALFQILSCSPREKSTSENENIYVAAYVWPSCHYGERNAEILWPEGIGEWEIIQKGTPRFEGHYQPKVPLWGYEMDDDPKVMEKWIDVASDQRTNAEAVKSVLKAEP